MATKETIERIGFRMVYAPGEGSPYSYNNISSAANDQDIFLMAMGMASLQTKYPVGVYKVVQSTLSE